MPGGRKAQAKGRRGELELAEILKERGFAAVPGAALNFGQEADVTGLPGIHIEVKRHERLEISRWYQQAQQDAARMKDGKPAVIYRQNRRPWMIVMTLSNFLDVYNSNDLTG